MAEKKKNTGFAFALWLLIALILVVFFFVKRDAILSNLKRTDFFARVFGKTPEFVEKHSVPEKSESNNLLEIEIADDKTNESIAEKNVIDKNPKLQTERESEPETQIAKGSLDEKPANQTRTKTQAEKSTSQTKSTTQTSSTKSQTTKPATLPKKTTPTKTIPQTVAKICFVIVDSDGSVSRNIVSRTLPKSDSPLTDALSALLSGPSQSERNQKVSTLIPAGTKLLGASVTNGIATLNFNEAFTFNTIGVQGYLAQLMQIVYTATQFSTVSSVQFIIEGEKQDYLGSEGTWIGSPLSRSSFR